MIKFLDLHAQYRSIQHDVDDAIARTLANTSFVGGPDHAAFEQEFAAFQSADHAIAVGNGTDAIEIALEALALPAGAEVLVPANSFIASSEAVTRSGLQVVFCEADETTGLIDISDAQMRVTPATAAVIAVHLYGRPCNMDALVAFARAHDLRVIEDCAQAHGAEWNGRRVGAIGDIGTFSFYPGKNLGAYGDGGAILTNNPELARKCRMIANHGRIDKYDHQFEGRNSRLDGLQGAILRAKLPHLDGWVDRRNAVARRYHDGLSGVAGLELLEPLGVGHRHAYHLFVVRCEARDALQQHLKADGIESGIHYPIALPDLAAYDYLRAQGAAPCPRASANGRMLLSLPIGEHLSDGDVDAVIASVKRFFGEA